MSLFSNIGNDLDLILYSLKHDIYISLGIIIILFAINEINRLHDYKLNVFGIYPRNVFGLVGIFCAPFLHGNFNHLFFNAFPLFALMHMVMLAGLPAFYMITLLIMLIGGGLTWLLGRRCLHVGSSSVVMGYFGYLAIYSYIAPGFISVIAIGICLYYFGGLVLSLVPTDKTVSWEGHIFGFIGGIAAFYLTPKLLPVVADMMNAVTSMF